MLLSAAFLSASAGILLYKVKLSSALPLLILSVILAAALGVHYRKESFRGSWIIPRYRIEDLVVEAVSDSRKIRGGKEILEIKVRTYSGSDTEELRLSPPVTAYIAGNRRYYKGEVLFIHFGKYIKKGSFSLSVKEKNITPLFWSSRIFQLRGNALDAIYRKVSFLDKTSRMLFTAFFLGKKNSPSDPLFRDFTRAGASHLLALSGMHLGILSGGIMLVLSPFFGRRRSFLISLPLLSVYLFLTGISPSLFRAFLFLCLLGVSMLAGIKPDYFHILALTFLFHCYVNPLSAGTVSFKLSYLALAGIFLFSRSLTRSLPGIIPHHIRTVLAASTAAQLGTLPVVLYFFHAFYPVGIVSSLILIPLTSLFLLAGIIFLFLPAGWLLSAVLFLENSAGSVLAASVRFFSTDSSFNRAVILTLVFLTGYLLYKRHKVKDISAGVHEAITKL